MSEIPFVIYTEEDNTPHLGIDMGEYVYCLGPANKENIENLNQCFLKMYEEFTTITGTIH